MNKTRNTSIVCATAALLAACGGGGSDQPSSQAASAQGTLDVTANAVAAPAVASFRIMSTRGMVDIAPRAAVAAGFAATTRAHAMRYSFTDLGALPGQIGSYATGINDAGQVAGVTRWGVYDHATLWNGSTAIDLGTLGGRSSTASGINNAGQVVGSSDTTGDASTHATLWNGTTAIDLTPLGTDYSYASGINNVGQVVGGAAPAGDPNTHARLWSGATTIDLAPLLSATDINDAGQIVGIGVIGGIAQATIWDGTAAIGLGVPYGPGSSIPYAINKSAQVAGSSGGHFHEHAIFWNGTTATDLGALLRPDQASSSYATGINDVGQVVLNGVGHGVFAFLWNGTAAIDLNDLLPASAVSAGWILGTAEAINNKGSIVGAAGHAPTRVGHAYVLTPLTDKEQCKKDGWQKFDFPNQGQCIQFVNTGK